MLQKLETLDLGEEPFPGTGTKDSCDLEVLEVLLPADPGSLETMSDSATVGLYM